MSGSGHKPGAGEEDLAAFAEAVRGARPLARGPRRVAPGPAPAPAAAPRATPARPLPARAAPPSDLAVEDDGESWSGRAGGVDRRMLRKLRAGSVPVEAELDLHGLTRAAAAPALERFLAAARAAGRRCLLVIHGRGLHSEGGSAALRPVVRQALIGGASAGAVLAFTSAPPALGGSGATLIYLRRP